MRPESVKRIDGSVRRMRTAPSRSPADTRRDRSADAERRSGLGAGRFAVEASSDAPGPGRPPDLEAVQPVEHAHRRPVHQDRWKLGLDLGQRPDVLGVGAGGARGEGARQLGHRHGRHGEPFHDGDRFPARARNDSKVDVRHGASSCGRSRRQAATFSLLAQCAWTKTPAHLLPCAPFPGVSCAARLRIARPNMQNTRRVGREPMPRGSRPMPGTRYRAVEGAERAAAHLRLIACGPERRCFRVPHLLRTLQRRRCRRTVEVGAGRLRFMPRTPAYRLDTTRGDGAFSCSWGVERRHRRAKTHREDRVSGATYPRQ
jgi:hypothetical protein